MNISIFASIGAQNLGDELILKNEIALLQQEFGTDTQFQVASYDVKNPVFQISNTQYFEYFPIAIKNIRNTLRNIKNFFTFLKIIIWSDRVVIGGGGIIYDSELQSVGNPLDQWIFRTQVARFFRKKIYFYALGIDIKQEENFIKLEKIFKKAWKVSVRDQKSWEQLKKIGVQSIVVDDPVMSESSGRGNILGIHASKSFSLKDFEKYNLAGKKIGLALRSGYIGKSNDVRIERLLVAELCSYLESRGAKIIFLPHSFHTTDLQANDYVFMQQFLTPQRDICANMTEVYDWYQRPVSIETGLKSKLVISMRLHSIILSYVYNIPQIVLSYSQKTEELLKKLEQ